MRFFKICILSCCTFLLHLVCCLCSECCCSAAVTLVDKRLQSVLLSLTLICFTIPKSSADVGDRLGWSCVPVYLAAESNANRVVKRSLVQRRRRPYYGVDISSDVVASAQHSPAVDRLPLLPLLKTLFSLTGVVGLTVGGLLEVTEAFA